MKKFWAKKVIKKMKGGGPLGIVPAGLQKMKSPLTKGVEKWGAKNLGIGSVNSDKKVGSDWDPTKESSMAGGGAIKGRLEKEFTEDVKLAHGGIHKPVKVTPQDVLRKKAEGGWIQSAVKKPGALRAVAAKEGLIKGKEKLSSSDLNKLGSQAKKSGNSLLAKRVLLAKTFAKMRKKK